MNQNFWARTSQMFRALKISIKIVSSASPRLLFSTRSFVIVVCHGLLRSPSFFYSSYSPSARLVFVLFAVVLYLRSQWNAAFTKIFSSHSPEHRAVPLKTSSPSPSSLQLPVLFSFKVKHDRKVNAKSLFYFWPRRCTQVDMSNHLREKYLDEYNTSLGSAVFQSSSHDSNVS